MAKTWSAEQEMHAAFIMHYRDEFRKRGWLYTAYAKELGISRQWLYNICNYKREGLPLPSVSALKRYREKLDVMLEYYDM